MRKVIAEIAMSLDGFIEGPNGEMDWITTDESYQANKLINRFDTVFYGRKAYERFGMSRSENDYEQRYPIPFNGNLETMRKYVFSNSMKHVNGNGMVVHSRFMEEVLRIRDEEGKDILLCGGATMIQSFAAKNLIDEYLIAIHPVILGSGKPLFREVDRSRLKLISANILASGIVIVNYKPCCDDN